MAESDRPSSSSSSSGDRYLHRARIPLKQSRSVDATSCMFEIEGLDDDDRLDPTDNNILPVESFGGNRKGDLTSSVNISNRRRRIGVTSIERDDEDFNNNTNDNNEENNDDDNDGEESNNIRRNKNYNNGRNRRGKRQNADDDFTDEDNDEEDEDDDDDDDDDENDGSDSRNMFQRMSLNSKCTRQFATSLPIQVPLWKTSPLNQETDDTEKNITCDEDLGKLAESFRALARSVKDGTTEMFGALPRHRLKSRPI